MENGSYVAGKGAIITKQQYDDKGNVIKEIDAKGTVTKYAYDDPRRVIQVTQNAEGEKSGLSAETAPEAGSADQIKTITQENLYNGNGQRIRKSEGAKEINYFYQDGVVSYTTEGSGAAKAVQNLLGLEENMIMAESDSLGYYLYNKDIQGSTTSILNEDGTGGLPYEYDDSERQKSMEAVHSKMRPAIQAESMIRRRDFIN